MRASIQLNPTNYIHFDTPIVADTINKTGEYKKDKILVKRWGEESVGDKKFYLLKSDEKPNKFTGIINLFFEREGYGVNEHDNGDKYFGYYRNNVRNGHGIYSFLPQKKNDQLLSEFYYGFWKTDLKSGHGIYLWLREDASIEPFSNFEKSNFQALVGDVERDIFKKGTLLSKEGEDYMVFHGTFDLDGKREGNNCFFFSSSLEEMLFGKYSEDQFVSGYVAHFDEEGKVKDFLKYDDGQITPKEKLGEEEFNKNSKLMLDFRNVIMGKDYFGDVYNEFKKVKEFEKTKMSDLDIFNSDQYLTLMSVATGYNKVTIFNDIEKNVEYNK